MDCLLKLANSTLPSIDDRVLVGTPQFIFALCSLVVNGMLLVVLVKQAKFLSFGFKAHLVSLIVASLGFNVVAVAVFVPVVLFGLLLPDVLLIVVSTPDSLFYQAIMFITTVIALERCSLFLFPKMHEMLSKQLLPVLIVAPWALALFIVTHSTLNGCYKRVDPFSLRYTYACSIDCGLYDPILFYAAFLFPAVIFTSYVTLFAFLYFHSSKVGRAEVTRQSTQRQHVLFAVQFTIIAFLQFCGSSFFYLLPKWFGDGHLVSSILTSISTINSMANPICMFVFQPSIRDSFSRLGISTLFLPYIVVSTVFERTERPSASNMHDP